MELLDGLGDDLRVEQAHLRGEGFVVELPGRGRGGRVVVRLVVDVVEAVGGQGRVDVALNVGRFEGALVGAHAELLDERGVRAGQDQGGDDGDGHAGHGQAPRAAEGSHHEEGGDQEGDDRQDRVRGERGVDVGVHGAVDGAALRGQQLVAAQPVVDADEHREGGGHEAGLESRVLGGVGARGQADRPVQVGHDEGGGQPDTGDGHEEGDEHLERGQDEHEEGNVQAELGIYLVEGRGVEELQERAPFGGQTGAVGESEEEGDSPEGEAPHGLERLLVAAQRRGCFPARRGGAVTVGEGHREVQEPGRDQQAHDEEAEVGAPLGEDDARGAHLAEPQDFRPHDGGPVDDGGDERQRGQRDRAGAGLAELHLDARGSPLTRLIWLIGSEDREWEAHSNPLC